MRVLIVDDHEVLWSGMRGVLERLVSTYRPGDSFQMRGARDLASAQTFAGSTFDLVLLDYHLPDVEGLEALHAVRLLFDAVPIVMLSADENPALIRGAVESGAAGYIPKTMPEREMVAALSLVLAHGIYLPAIALLEPSAEHSDLQPSIGSEAMATFMRTELSPRQREVFARALRGKPNKVISRELGIAEGTVKVHLAMVYRALGVRNRTEAMYRVLSADAADALARL